MNQNNKDKHTEIMKQINNEYAFLKDNIGKKYDKKDYENTQKYRFFDNELFEDYGIVIVFLEKLLKQFPEITIELIGCYFWLTMPNKHYYKKHKEEMKLASLGFKYNFKREKFMRSPGGLAQKTRWSNKSFSSIKSKYGCETMQAQDKKLLAM